MENRCAEPDADDENDQKSQDFMFCNVSDDGRLIAKLGVASTKEACLRSSKSTCAITRALDQTLKQWSTGFVLSSLRLLGAVFRELCLLDTRSVTPSNQIPADIKPAFLITLDNNNGTGGMSAKVRHTSCFT